MKSIRIEIKWAIIFVLVTLAWMAMEKLTGLHDVNIEHHAVVTNLFFIPAVLTYVLALLDKRKNFYNNEMSYKQAFISGVIVSAIVTLFSPLTQYITSAVISPDYFTNIIAYTVKNNLMTEEAAQEYFSLGSYMKQVVIATPIMGIFTTAIVAIFVKNKKRHAAEPKVDQPVKVA